MNTVFRIVQAIVVLMANAASRFAAGQSGKLPITTSSQAAKSEYLKGLALADNLRAPGFCGVFPKRNAGGSEVCCCVPEPRFYGTKQGCILQRHEPGRGQRSQRFRRREAVDSRIVDAAAKGEPNKQGEYLQKLVAAYPQDERAHNLPCSLLLRTPQYDNAITEFQKAVSLNPDFAPSYNMLGYSYRFNDSSINLNRHSEIHRIDPQRPQSLRLLRRIVDADGRYDESIDNYRKALQQDAHFTGSSLGIATDLNFQGEHEKAREELQKVYDSARNDGERRTALLGMTISYLDEGNSQKRWKSRTGCWRWRRK